MVSYGVSYEKSEATENPPWEDATGGEKVSSYFTVPRNSTIAKIRQMIADSCHLPSFQIQMKTQGTVELSTEEQETKSLSDLGKSRISPKSTAPKSTGCAQVLSLQS